MEAGALVDRLRGKTLELIFEGKENGKAKWQGVLAPPAASLELTYLGAGTNKMAFLVKNTQWVLCFGYNLFARRDAVLSDFRDEVETLVRLGQQGVRVPKPFPASPPSPNFIFEMSCDNTEAGRSGQVYAFVLEFMSRDHFVEMPKTANEKLNFAKTHVVPGGRLPATLKTTKDDLARIMAAWKIRKWGDFQVMYHKTRGTMTVFDPQATDGIQEQHERVMKQWVDDITSAEAIQGKWIQPGKSAGGYNEV